MRILCWITKATNTHSEYETLIALPRQQLLRELALLLHVYVPCCLVIHIYFTCFVQQLLLQTEHKVQGITDNLQGQHYLFHIQQKFYFKKNCMSLAKIYFR